MLDGKGWKLPPRANALGLKVDTTVGKSIEVSDLGHDRNDLIRKLSSQTDIVSNYEECEAGSEVENNPVCEGVLLLEPGLQILDMLSMIQ